MSCPSHATPDPTPARATPAAARLGRALGEDGEQVELLCGEIDRLAVAGGAAARPIDVHPTGSEAGLHPSSTADRTDAGTQLAHREGLHNIVIRTEFEPDNAIGLIPARRNDDDGDVGDGAHRSQHIQSVVVREPEIEQDDVSLARRVEDLYSEPDVNDVQPVTAQSVEERLGDRRVVLHDQNSHASSSLRGPMVSKPRRQSSSPS
jgi:hypothetical protein